MSEPFPFLGRVLHYREGLEIVTERVLELGNDLFLADHLLARGAREVKPLPYCFPVVPFTVLMEAMAEVASCLAPGCGVIGFEDIQAIRWVGLREVDRLPLEISARADGTPESTDTRRVEVEIFTSGQAAPNARGTVVLGHRYRQHLDLAFPEPDNPRPHPLSGGEIYARRHLFHGPFFQTITGRPVLADRAVIGTLAVLPKRSMFGSNREPALIIDPVLLDGAMQLFALWSMQHGGGAYPIGARKVEFYSPPPAIGATVPAHIRVSHRAYRLVEGDIEIQDGTGHVWLRAQGWKQWLFRWPDRVSRFLSAPTRECLSLDLNSPPPPGAAVQCLQKADLGDLALPACADHYLHVAEMARFHELSASPENQLEWMLGRITVKDAVRRCLAPGAESEMLHPASFTIADGASGDMTVEHLPAGTAVPTIRVTHSNGRVVCTARL